VCRARRYSAELPGTSTGTDVTWLQNRRFRRQTYSPPSCDATFSSKTPWLGSRSERGGGVDKAGTTQYRVRGRCDCSGCHNSKIARRDRTKSRKLSFLHHFLRLGFRVPGLTLFAWSLPTMLHPRRGHSAEFCIFVNSSCQNTFQAISALIEEVHRRGKV